MRFKKFVGALSALTVAASVFAGLAVTANAADTLLLSEDFEGDTVSSVLSGGEVISTTYAGKVYRINSGTVMTATFDSDTNSDGNQPYTPDNGMAIAVSYVGFHGYLNSNQNAVVTFKNSDGTALASYTYNSASCTITDVKLMGSTPSDFTEIDVRSRNSKGTKFNQFSQYVKDAGANATITFIVGGDGSISLNFNQSVISLDKSFSMTLGSDIKADIASMTIDSAISNDTRAYGIDDFSVTQKALGEPYTINYTMEGNTDPIRIVSGYAAVNDVITADTRFEVSGTRYYSIDTIAATMTVQAVSDTVSNTLNVPVRAAYNYEMSAYMTGASTDLIKSQTVVEGDDFYYSYSKYLTDTENKVTAVCDNETFSDTVTPVASDSFYVNYSTYEGTAYFVEAEKVISSTTMGSGNLSGGTAVRGINGTAKEVLTIPESGIYTVTYAAVTSNYGEGKGGTVAVYKNSADDANLINSLNVDYITVTNAKTTGTIAKENVELNAGDRIVVLTSMSTGAIDYVLAEKTGNIEQQSVLPSAETAVISTTEVDGQTVDCDYVDNDGNAASVWNATLRGVSTNPATIRSLKATVTLKETGVQPKTEWLNTSAISGSSDIRVLVYVNRAKDAISSISVEACDTAHVE